VIVPPKPRTLPLTTVPADRPRIHVDSAAAPANAGPLLELLARLAGDADGTSAAGPQKSEEESPTGRPAR
jgi:hypothetical protein